MKKKRDCEDCDAKPPVASAHLGVSNRLTRTPSVTAHFSFHCRGDAKCLMNPAEVIPEEERHRR